MSDSQIRKRSPKPRINFELPARALEQVRDRALEQGLTVTGYMLRLIERDGLDVSDDETGVDGRTLRGKLRQRSTA